MKIGIEYCNNCASNGILYYQREEKINRETAVHNLHNMFIF